MNKTAIRKFAEWAREKLIEDIKYKAGTVGITANGIVEKLPQSTSDTYFYDVGTKDYTKISGIEIKQRDALVKAIQTKERSYKSYQEAFENVIEEVAYTWFNRLIAIRFMEVNDYLPSGVRVLSSENKAKKEPDLVTTPFDTDLEFTSYEQGLESWNKYYGGRESTLTNRMVFIEDAEGRKAATATAYYDVRKIDRSGDGWLHWVAVRREYQGQGLAKPLITHVLDIMRKLGYTHAKIPTQTTTWLACKIYLDLGFRPIPQNAVHSRDGWRIVKALTNHAALDMFDAAKADEIIRD